VTEGPEPHPALRTKLCELVGVRYPIVQTGMGWVAGPRLVAATANAGGLGILASATMTVDELTAAIAEVRTRTTNPFGVNLRTDAPDVEERVALLVRSGVKVASFAQAPRPDLVTRLAGEGIIVIPTVGARRHAEKVAEWGVHGVIAQGAEGGGHTGPVPTTLLLPQVVDAVGERVAVIAAGGFSSGRGLVAALAYGAAGIAMGTRFLLTQESTVPDAVKEIYLGTPVTGTVVTTRVDGAPQRVIRTSIVDHLEGAGRIGAPGVAQRTGLSAPDEHLDASPGQGGTGHERGQRAVLVPGGHGRQRADDDQGRSGRRPPRGRDPPHRPSGRRHR
jgi:NAD(P)H-dependent flavin oxidoreductase YrpB (nitropropane dioxygenase family)